MMVIALALSLLSFSSFALSPSEIKDAIQYQMNQRHPDLPADFWTNLGPESLPVLKQMFETSTSPYQQAWILDGLAHFSDPSIGTLLQSKIGKENNAVLKKKEFEALIQSQGDAAFDFVEPYLNDSDPHIRIAVAIGLQNYAQGSRIEKRLAQFKAAEKLDWVKKEVERKPDLNRMKRAGTIYQNEKAEAEEKEKIKPLSEKEWVGEWKGVLLTPARNSSAKATLTLLNAKWKVELLLPKQTRYSLKDGEFEVVYYTSDHAHFLEVRNKKEDSVFIGQRKPKKGK